MTLGIMMLYPGQEETYYNGIGKCSVNMGISVLLFTPQGADLSNGTVDGFRYSKDKGWVQGTSPLPSFIYDRCFYQTESDLQTFRPIVQQLKKRSGITFLGHGLPGKWAVYQLLFAHSAFIDKLIPTISTSHPASILRFLNEHKAVLLKPVLGSCGQGIHVIEKKKEDFILIKQYRKHTSKKAISEHTLIKELSSILLSNRMIAQPFLNLQTPAHEPFDVRILLQKNEEGRWVERGRGIRCGKPGGIVSNLAARGSVMVYELFMKRYTDQQKADIEWQLQEAVRYLPGLLEERFGSLFELGVDFGIDLQGKVWLLEVNSKPGHKVIVKTNPQVMPQLWEAPLRFYQYLKKKKEVDHRVTTITH